jgi:hypothetical protein
VVCGQDERVKWVEGGLAGRISVTDQRQERPEFSAQDENTRAAALQVNGHVERCR